MVVKLDIDHSDTEAAFLTQMLDDPEVLYRIDEFYFEFHVGLGFSSAAVPGP